MDESHSLSAFRAIGGFDLQCVVGESEFLSNGTSQGTRTDSVDDPHPVTAVGGRVVQYFSQTSERLRHTLASKVAFNDAPS